MGIRFGLIIEAPEGRNIMSSRGDVSPLCGCPACLRPLPTAGAVGYKTSAAPRLSRSFAIVTHGWRRGLQDFRQSAAVSFVCDRDPRLAPWATKLPPLRGCLVR